MEFETLMRFLLAALWGGIVGIEREYRSKSAGFRTMIMISIGACFFTIMSVQIGVGNNPDRIASNIVTGIGFLGAGVIFRGQNRVNGITTAATIWAVAAVGMGIGAGYYLASAAASILILLVLAILPYVEQFVDELNRSREYSITCDYTGEVQLYYEGLLRKNRLRFKVAQYNKQDGHLSITWEVQGHLKGHNAFIQAVNDTPGVKAFTY